MHLQRVSKHFPKFMRNGTEKLVITIWHFYIELVAKTSRIKFIGLEEIQPNRMIGFWHEDSYCVQLILRKLKKMGKMQDDKFDVIVTKERRGDYIADMIKKYGASPMRLPDGMEMRSFMKDLKQDSKKEGSTLVAAMDGPNGPYHKPKRLLFLLAHEAGKGFSYARFEKKGVMRLLWRWDKYRIPLPFTRMTCRIDYFGNIEQANLRSFDEYVAEHFQDIKEISQKEAED